MEPLISVAACHVWHAALCLDELQSRPATGQPLIAIKHGKMRNVSRSRPVFLSRVQNYEGDSRESSCAQESHGKRGKREVNAPATRYMVSRENAILLVHATRPVGSDP